VGNGSGMENNIRDLGIKRDEIENPVAAAKLFSGNTHVFPGEDYA
jgi:hypothetical protein